MPVRVPSRRQSDHMIPLPEQRGRVLIVDDEPANRSLLVRILTKDGYETDTAANGKEALLALERSKPDLMLLDIEMPGINGFELCTQIKQRPDTRLLPIVLVTGLGDREHRIRGIRAGCDDFIAKPFDSDELQARVRSLVRLKHYTDDLDSAEAILRSLALTIEARDAYTLGHCDRLASYSVELGRHLGLPAEDLSALHRGGYLHDIGKVGIPDALLLKPTRLTSAEFETMKRHTVIGDRLCGELRSLKLVRQIVRHHHELFDGSGYPDGLRGNDIPLLAQIVGVADLFDAMTTDRPYRRALTPEQAVDTLTDEAERGLRRADLVDLFVSLARNGELARSLTA
jgi:putative two-component system response regulator